jgi:ATP-dependent Clp protease adaptor protein ClpS
MAEPTRQADPELEVAEQELSRLAPRYNVVLLDDDDHTYDYVIEMLQRLFGHSYATAFEMASEVDRLGRVIVLTTAHEQAEFKRDQILAYGADWRLQRSSRSMRAFVEPAD